MLLHRPEIRENADDSYITVIRVLPLFLIKFYNVLACSVVLVHYDFINFNYGVIADVKTFSAVVAYLPGIEVAHIALPAFDTLSVVKYAIFSSLVHTASNNYTLLNVL